MKAGYPELGESVRRVQTVIRQEEEQFLKNLEPYPEPEKTRFWRKLRRLARLGRKAKA